MHGFAKYTERVHACMGDVLQYSPSSLARGTEQPKTIPTHPAQTAVPFL